MIVMVILYAVQSPLTPGFSSQDLEICLSVPLFAIHARTTNYFHVQYVCTPQTSGLVLLVHIFTAQIILCHFTSFPLGQRDTLSSLQFSSLSSSPAHNSHCAEKATSFPVVPHCTGLLLHLLRLCVSACTSLCLCHSQARTLAIKASARKSLSCSSPIGRLLLAFVKIQRIRTSDWSSHPTFSTPPLLMEQTNSFLHC